MTVKYNQVLIAANDYMLATDTDNEYLTLEQLKQIQEILK